jgi:hypothetical protein
MCVLRRNRKYSFHKYRLMETKVLSPVDARDVKRIREAASHWRNRNGQSFVVRKRKHVVTIIRIS